MYAVMDKPKNSAKPKADPPVSDPPSAKTNPLVLVGELLFVAWVLGIGWYFYRQLGFGDLILQLVGGQP